MKMMHRIPCDWEGYSIAGRQTQKKMTERKWSEQHWTSVLGAGVGVGMRMKIFMRGYYRFILNNSPAKISLLPEITGTKGGPF